MQAPPSGGKGTPGQQRSEAGYSADNGRERSSDSAGGNMTAPMRPGGMNEKGNMTPPDFGNKTSRKYGNMMPSMFGNETAGNQSSHEMRGGHGFAGNSMAPTPPDNSSRSKARSTASSVRYRHNCLERNNPDKQNFLFYPEIRNPASPGGPARPCIQGRLQDRGQQASCWSLPLDS